MDLLGRVLDLGTVHTSTLRNLSYSFWPLGLVDHNVSMSDKHSLGVLASMMRYSDKQLVLPGA